MRTAFYISDGTAITAEVFGHALLTLFPAEFEHVTIPFVESIDMAQQVKQRINDRYKTTGAKPLIFQTFVDDNLRHIINSSEGICYDFLNSFVEPIQRELGIAPVPKTHRTHSIHEKTYDFRIDAVNFALANDDGANVKDYDKADVILVGVSRSGKTPTSLYLALQFGIKAANYPFVEEDMDQLKLPAALQRNKSKLFGLTITAERLSQIREQRKSNSRYASLRQCQIELNEVENLYRQQQIPFLNSTHLSIEEISAKIMAITGLKRRKI
ncbi:posphoenolpyruvate synthetase regulatory kinase/phosphorylase PpsR [Rheinheimera salexigens]|uniref:Putative phosphoenolpyruvate synthase regulatory protein n=1 Tax=Rheinheimera salexigens TaxID=1628148 RepID=A0A1E7Q615_9GAMM|nr:pyruvate, water dikinase regulatory protein [Rheinheimera salexigens]OEY69624.1 phosphoenolpyruvate synthase regulatory protein [Rheinheimera salexigens]